MAHSEHHRTERVGWLRAAVLGANDGIVSTSSLLVGVAAAQAAREDVVLAGIAGLVAGAMSMAAGEYVSVRSQADLEEADLAVERRELREDPEGEHLELTMLLEARGLDRDLAERAAAQMAAHDALGAHAIEELGIVHDGRARPFEAALASAAAFAVGAGLPLGVAYVAPEQGLGLWVTAASLVGLALLGVLSANAGGARPLRAALRVTFWGALAMALTAGVGRLVGTGV